MTSVNRDQVMAYRIAAHGLHREVPDAEKLAVFDLGVQDVTARDTARLALAARLAGPAPSLVDDARFTLAWSHRGAPHYHRSDELRRLIPSLVPVDDSDAGARMLWQRKEIESADLPMTEILTTAAKALREVVVAPMTKGAASTAVTALLPGSFSRWCRPCGATHIHEQLMRLAAPLAGVRLEAGITPATLAPLARRSPIPTEPDIEEARRTVERYLRLHGPATATEAAGFVGTTRKIVADALWPNTLATVTVDGRTRYLPADSLPTLENPPEPTPIRLLPPWDPFLQARDRATLVPDKNAQKEIWRILGNPGAVLANGELAGTWRATTSGSRLDVTVTSLLPLPRQARAELEPEAVRVAETRGLSGVSIKYD